MMANRQKQEEPFIFPFPQGRGRGYEEEEEENREFDAGSDEPGTPLPLTSRVMYMLVDLKQWLELVRKRTRSSLRRLDPLPLSAGESNPDSNSLPTDQATERSLWDRLGEAALLDVESNSFSWSMLSSLHHTQHSGSPESDDDTSKALEVTVNSGGVVFFALFNKPENDDPSLNQAAAVIKISSSRIATQSERLGYEFAKWLGVRVPQARVIHSTSPEWLQIKESAEKARGAAVSEKDEVGEMTCAELLEALELSRYVHGSPLMENAKAFDSKEAAEKIATALGRILVLDLVIRNEDRLCCRQLGWRGNSANLLLADKSASANMDKLGEACDSAVGQFRPSVLRALHKDRRTTSGALLESQRSDLSEASDSSVLSKLSLKDESTKSTVANDIHIVAIDSGVPRRPPVGKRASDQENYPKLVELILNSSTYSSNLLHEITGGKLGSTPQNDASIALSATDMAAAIAFRNGFRAALRDLQGFQIFLLTLHQKLDSLLRSFLNIINKNSSGEVDREEVAVPESPVHYGSHSPSPTPTREHSMIDHTVDLNMDVVKTPAKPPSSSDSTSPTSREGWHGKSSKGVVAESLRSLRLTAKLRDLHKYAKVDAELSKELEQWNEMLRNDAVKLCQDNKFNTGFFEGSDNSIAIDAYELKIRLEHILERISLISDAANTEKPSLVTSSMFIGGALAARSVHTLQYIGITHILCLCANEIGQSESQYPDLFEYKSFSITDEEDSNISSIFEDGCDFIDHVEQTGGKVLVHCFEGRSRSATMVLAYLILRKNLTLSEAWNKLKKAHRRAQPNDGFARILLELDKKLHGKASMEWQQRKPTMKVVDSAMTLEIEKAMKAVKVVSHGGGSVSSSPTARDNSFHGRGVNFLLSSGGSLAFCTGYYSPL
ncbi:hypothetical protein V2J09_006940 [Rumex salicifolius]